jgi:hypothetical protein
MPAIVCPIVIYLRNLLFSSVVLKLTCMVFAALMVDGVKGHEDCPTIDDFSRKKLSEHMSQFRFDM